MTLRDLFMMFDGHQQDIWNQASLNALAMTDSDKFHQVCPMKKSQQPSQKKRKFTPEEKAEIEAMSHFTK
jgi:hypothetical protein